MIKKRITALLTALFVLTALTGLSVFAYDVDFSIKPQESSANQGDSLTVNIVITTQDKGYTAFKMQLLYDESVFSCESQYNNNGYTGSGKNGVYELIYQDPSIDEPSPTKSGDAITIPVKFTVLSDAALGDTKFNASVISCTGVNNLDLNSPVKLELAQLLSKTVKINEGEPNTDEPLDDEPSDISSDDNGIGSLIDQPTLPAKDDDSINWAVVVGIIIGGIVVFFSGCVVGYLFKQKQTDSAREDYYSSRRHHHYSDSNNVDINDSHSAYAGVNGIARNGSESTQGGRNYGNQQTAQASQPINQQQYPPTATIAKENTFSGYSATINPYSNGYKQQAPMQTSYATGALQTSPQQPSAQYGNPAANPNAGQPTVNPFSAVAPKTFGTGSNNQQPQNNQWQANQNSYAGQAQPASTFSVQQNSQPAVATSFNTAQKIQNDIEMAYRGEGTVGTYRPTPPVQGAYAPAYSQYAPGQPQNANASQPAAPAASAYQPTPQKPQQQQFKTEYTIGRSGYGLNVNQPQQQQNFSTNPQTGSYLQPQSNPNVPQQNSQPQAAVQQNRFLTGNNQQPNNGFNNNSYRK